MRLIDGDALKGKLLKYFTVHKQHQKRKALKDHTEEICRDICFAIDAQPELNTVPYTDGFNDGYAQCKRDAQPSNGACWGCQCEKMEKLQPERSGAKMRGEDHEID